MTIVKAGEWGPDFYADPYPQYAELRADRPVHEVWTDDGTRFWLLVGYEEGRLALADRRLSKCPPTPTAEGSLVGKHVLITDPPDHTRLRRLISQEFTARRVDGLRPRVQEITDQLLDAMLPRGGADLVEALAYPLPMTVLFELLGVPNTDRAEFTEWTTNILAPAEPAADRVAGRALFDYLDGLIEDKRRSAATDDLLSALVRANAEDGDRLSDAELRSTVFVLLLAGYETSANLISNAVRVLLGHPDQLAALRADPTLIDGAIEEVLRFEGSVESASKRFTTEPVRYGDTVIPAGETVWVSLAAAGRDPSHFAAADTFDIRRTNAGSGHLAFGHGIHYCLGAPLARMESRIAVGTLLARCPDLALDIDPKNLDWLPDIRVRGVRRLPVRW
jgi:cytochrome P450